jgi:hypothetical protein
LILLICFAGGEGGEEDVDIDDDLAPAKFAPVAIDKDGGAVAGETKSSSSDSDSSDTGSSSSGKSMVASPVAPEHGHSLVLLSSFGSIKIVTWRRTCHEKLSKGTEEKMLSIS